MVPDGAGCFLAAVLIPLYLLVTQRPLYILLLTHQHVLGLSGSLFRCCLDAVWLVTVAVEVLAIVVAVVPRKVVYSCAALVYN